MEIPALEVRYEHVKVDAEAHVGTRALPSFFNFYINFFEVNLQSNQDYFFLAVLIKPGFS